MIEARAENRDSTALFVRNGRRSARFEEMQRFRRMSGSQRQVSRRAVYQHIAKKNERSARIRDEARRGGEETPTFRELADARLLKRYK